MAYAWTQRVPITPAIYAEIAAELGPEPPDGLIAHVARLTDDGHLEYLDVWESEAACERFTEERLHPVVGRALARHQIRVAGEPPRQPVDVVHVWTQTASRALR